MIEIEDIKGVFKITKTKETDATKEKIKSLMEDEKINKEKNFSAEEQQQNRLKSEKKKLSRYSIISICLFVLASGLLYTAFSSKITTELQFQQQIKTLADKDINSLINQADSTIKKQTQFFISSLQSLSQQSFESVDQIKTLESQLKLSSSHFISLKIIPANYKDDDIIDNPEMGYTILYLLNELKNITNTPKANLTKIESHNSQKKNKTVLFIQKIINKEDTIAYIIASLSMKFISQMFPEFSVNDGYFEVVQKHGATSSILIKKGASELKSLLGSIDKRLANTPWIIKYWRALQGKKVTIDQFWLAFLYLGLAVIAMIIAIIFLILFIKKYRILNPVVKPSKEESSNESFLSKLAPGKINKNKQKDPTKNKNYTVNKKIADNIFRAYDIRGVVGEFINTDVFRKISRVIANELKEKNQTKIAVACDGRSSSPQLVNAVINTLLEQGIEVMDFGMVGSPILYYAALNKTDGNGLMITASHNAADYNGIKIMLSGISYSDKKLQLLKQAFLNDDESNNPTEKVLAEKSEIDIITEYSEKITQDIQLSRPMKIVIDTANGVTGKYAAKLFRLLNSDVTVLNETIDGSFPAHAPDPSRPENLTELTQKVLEVKADVGFAFDGDGDRLGLISSDGKIIWPDRILMLLAKDILSRNNDATILYDVKSTKNLISFIENLGGKSIMCASGHSLMKNKLKQTGAILAGEMSGHIFIKERWFGFDDAIYVAARILEILSVDLRKSGHIFAELPDSLNTPEILIQTKEAASIMKKIVLDNTSFGDGKIINVDGVRVEYPDGWGLIRSSNTSDNLTLRFEADNEEALQRIANAFKKAITAVSEDLQLPF